jgi:hypothetical protein
MAATTVRATAATATAMETATTAAHATAVEAAATGGRCVAARTAVALAGSGVAACTAVALAGSGVAACTVVALTRPRVAPCSRTRRGAGIAGAACALSEVRRAAVDAGTTEGRVANTAIVEAGPAVIDEAGAGEAGASGTS